MPAAYDLNVRWNGTTRAAEGSASRNSKETT